MPGRRKGALGTFRGPGDQTTPAFEVGNPWGYAFSSAGYGDLGVEVLNENGETVPGTAERYSSGGLSNGGGGAEFAFSGAYKLKVEADEGLEYEVLVCDGGIGPAGPPGMERRPN